MRTARRPLTSAGEGWRQCYGSGGRAAVSAAAQAALPPLKRQRGLCLRRCRTLTSTNMCWSALNYHCTYSFISPVHIISSLPSFFTVNIILHSFLYIFIIFAAAALLHQQEQRRPYLFFVSSPLLLLRQQKQRQNKIRLQPSPLLLPSPSSSSSSSSAAATARALAAAR